MAVYPNRTDLQNKPQKIAKAAAKGQTYGQATQQLAAQAAMPMASGDITTPSPAPQQAAPAGPVPGVRGAFDRPTEAPTEPITAGAPFGAGPTPGQLAMPTALGRTSAFDEIKALYDMFPNEDLAALLDATINRSY